MNRQRRRAEPTNLKLFHRSAWLDLPHLQNVFCDSHNSCSSITEIEYSHQWQHILGVRHKDLDFDDKRSHLESGNYLESLTTAQHESCRRKLIIVEDVCSVLIEQLVDLFDLNPEMFEEHLSGSNWHQTDEPNISGKVGRCDALERD